MAELAQARLDMLEEPGLRPEAARDGSGQPAAAGRFRSGDRYEMRYLDGLTGIERYRSTVRVTRVTDDLVEYTGIFGAGTRGAATPAGAMVDDSVNTYDPPVVMVPGGDFQVGRRWSGRSIRKDRSGRQGWIDYTSRVVARETVQVEGGTFETYRLEVEAQFDSGIRLHFTAWMQPEWGFPVKARIERRASAGGPLDVVVREMLSRSRGP